MGILLVHVTTCVFHRLMENLNGRRADNSRMTSIMQILWGKNIEGLIVFRQQK